MENPDEILLLRSGPVSKNREENLRASAASRWIPNAGGNIAVISTEKWEKYFW